FQAANLGAFLGIFVLLVVGFRALTPFVLVVLFLLVGTMGTLLVQTLLFQGVNMIATAGGLIVIGVGSDYGIVFVLAYRKELERLTRDRQRVGRIPPSEWLHAVRLAIRRALASIGSATLAGCVIAAASLLLLAGPEGASLVMRLLGLGAHVPGSFQPLRELGVGGAIGLVYCLALMLAALPAAVYLGECARSRPSIRRLGRRLGRPGSQRPSVRWSVWRGRARLALRADHERRWFSSIAQGVVRRRLWVVGAWLAVCGAALPLAARVRWSAGQKEVEPRRSEAVEVRGLVEKAFTRSAENLLVY